MYIKTLQKRTTNMQKKRTNTTMSVVGLYNPNPIQSPKVKVLVCPENKEYEGREFAIEASQSNIRNAAEYAALKNVEKRTAIDRMNAACRMAKAKERDPSPQMLFFFPSVTFSGEKMLVHIAPFSCKTPEFEGNTNIRYPVYGFAPVETFILGVRRNVVSRTNKTFDSINYFVSKKDPPIHEGYLNNRELGEKLAAEVEKNPLLDQFFGAFVPSKNSDLNNENAVESIKYQICIPNHPEIMLYGGVVSLYNYKDGHLLNTPEEILKKIEDDVYYVLSDGGNSGTDEETIRDVIKNRVLLRCISGFRIHEGLFDSNDPQMKNQRMQLDLNQRCSMLVADDPQNENAEASYSTCLPPLKRVPDEDRRLLHTVRSLTLLSTDGVNICYPLGCGLVVIRSRRKKDSDEIYYYLSLVAGFLTHRAMHLTTRFYLEGTEIDLSDQGIPRKEILPLLMIEDHEEAAARCRMQYQTMMESTEMSPPEEEQPEHHERDRELEPQEMQEDDLPF